jgi:flavin-dependent dehydrogenase
VRREDTLILGGGPAGAAAAITLARGHARPLLLERQRETGNALCGGFLSWHSLAVLDRLGLPPLAGAPVDHVRLFSRHSSASAPLPKPALGVSRRQLDTAMLAHAERLGVRIERGIIARELDGRNIHADGQYFNPHRLLLATGKHDVRGGGRPRPAGDPALGLRVRLGPDPALTRLVGGAIELHLFDRGYAGLAVQEDGSANLCLAVRRSRLREAGTPDLLLQAIALEAPAFGDRLAMRETGSGVDAVANVPYGWRMREGVAGLFRLGDQAAVIPSLAGEGMGIAIASGCSASAAYLRRGAGASAAWQRDFARDAARPIRVAGLVRDLAEGPIAARALPWLGRAPFLIRAVAHATRMK